MRLLLKGQKWASYMCKNLKKFRGFILPIPTKEQKIINLLSSQIINKL